MGERTQFFIEMIRGEISAYIHFMFVSTFHFLRLTTFCLHDFYHAVIIAC